MRTIDLDSLEVFCAVAAQGREASAAARFDRVRSTDTARLDQLETELGVALFNRQGRELALTGEGRKMLVYAERFLKLAGEASAALRLKGPMELLRIGSIENVAGVHLPSMLTRYRALAPQVSVEVSTMPTQKVLAALRAGTIDAGFITGPLDTPDLQQAPMFEYEVALVGPRDLVDDNLVALAEECLVGFPIGCAFRRILEAWAQQMGVKPKRYLECASFHAIAACVAGGSGVGILPRAILETLPAHDWMRAYSLPEALSRAPSFLVWRSEPGPSLQSFLDTARAEARGGIEIPRTNRSEPLSLGA